MRLYSLVVFCCLLCSTQAVALERFDVVTTAQLKALVDQRQAGMIDFTLVNTLDELIANTVSIPGSVNLPLNSVAQKISHLGKDKGRLIITYCMGYR